jgi:hypothetical protein
MASMLTTAMGLNPMAPPPPGSPLAGSVDLSSLYRLHPTSTATIAPQQGAASPMGVDATPMPTTPMGQNGFGVHSDVSVHDLANYLLPKFRNVESSGNYAADRAQTHPGQTASGAYQYLDSTWNNYKGYKRAVQAPKEIQDERMFNDLVQNLHQFKGDPFKTVANHYFPYYANDPTKWTQPLVDPNGKELQGAQTVKDYISSVLPKERVEQYLSQYQPPNT